ncbi:hypothetical protein M422DRAFT_30450 [Sphaerobolus stellatus SS14]|uniref:Helicase ATP-binding domain-containing protein n=1 Tax=Sphaerobolus stellatus (strain SS14) TaxID=990650 RepID=A0A0C9VPY5_SPHS4|nr:hypothetical protein M422DRAFT_30450 [Sphaerobolus stellatus SS14]
MSSPSSNDPYSLTNLLPVGCTYLYFDSDTLRRSHEALVAAKPTAYEDWPWLPPFLLTSQFCLDKNQKSDITFDEIEYLVKHRFIRATWRLQKDTVQIRVYLVPCDLSGVQGTLSLLNRKKKLGVWSHGRDCLRSLLSKTYSVWDGSHIQRSEVVLPVFEKDMRSLPEIYNNLPSPVVDRATFLSGLDEQTQSVIRSTLFWDTPPGMVSELYGYQKRTFLRMLQQEINPGTAPDPLYIPIPSVDGCGKIYYLQPTTMELLKQLPLRFQSKGGILCEEMGSGKTCIILALIVATKHQISTPEEKFEAASPPVLTASALCHFPFEQFKQERKLTHMSRVQCSFPSLQEILVHHARTSPNLRQKMQHQIQIESSDRTILNAKTEVLDTKLLKNNSHFRPFYHVYEPKPEAHSRKHRKVEASGPRRIYLTSATLVIVPRTLLAQWTSEINKHCAERELAVYTTDSSGHGRSNNSPLLDAPSLADYDVVLLTHERFAAEFDGCTFGKIPVWQRSSPEKCCGDVAEEYRVDGVSPLIQIRWKRLVVDEGHVSVANNDLARLCGEKLNVERRWIVSGTPTRNLMGLALGQTQALTPDGTAPDDMFESLPPPLSQEPKEADDELAYPADIIFANRWPESDREDLRRLGLMLSQFLKVPQFSAIESKQLFSELVVSPLLKSGGPRFASVRILTQVMSTVMFRHRIKDLEEELPDKLPPLKEKVVKLKFHPLAAKTYNILQAGIAINAVDSERTDQDYLFDNNQRSKAHLRTLLENITQTMFWKGDEKRFDIYDATERAEDSLKRAIDRDRPPEDIELVENSLRALREARNDQLWRAVVFHEDCPFVVFGLSSDMQRAWCSRSLSNTSDGDLLFPGQVTELREAMLAHRSSKEEQLVKEGYQARWKEQAKLARSLNRHRKRTHHDVDRMVKKFVSQANSKGTRDKILNEVNANIWKDSPSDFSAATNEAVGTLGNLPKITIGESFSSKLNYILRKVLKHASKHKFLIFSAFPLSLAIIGEALQFANIPYLPYTSQVMPSVRTGNVLSFQTSETYRVLLMELKHGAWGLNLAQASRIIFCEPVWQASVEAQAIKRAHRIGQNCSVLKVTTLVMRGTSEEAIVGRRRNLLNKTEQKGDFQEDENIRNYLQNPTFLRYEDIEWDNADQLKIPLIPVTKEADSEDMQVDIFRPAETEATEPPKKKLKKVHFA